MDTYAAQRIFEARKQKMIAMIGIVMPTTILSAKGWVMQAITEINSQSWQSFMSEEERFAQNTFLQWLHQIQKELTELELEYYAQQRIQNLPSGLQILGFAQKNEAHYTSFSTQNSVFPASVPQFSLHSGFPVVSSQPKAMVVEKEKEKIVERVIERERERLVLIKTPAYSFGHYLDNGCLNWVASLRDLARIAHSINKYNEIFSSSRILYKGKPLAESTFKTDTFYKTIEDKEPKIENFKEATMLIEQILNDEDEFLATLKKNPEESIGIHEKLDLIIIREGQEPQRI